MNRRKRSTFARRGSHIPSSTAPLPAYVEPPRGDAPSRGLFIAAMTLGAILIAVVMWCVLNPAKAF